MMPGRVEPRCHGFGSLARRCVRPVSPRSCSATGGSPIGTWGDAEKVGEPVAGGGGARAPLAALIGLTVLVVACYGGVLFGGQQFAFRDSAHFYYPLDWRVQQEWSAGRLPLWEPGANGGMPMLGSPMAAVLYPGKVIFALVPYAWGIRLYTVGHEVLAFWAMLALMRSWGVSRTGATWPACPTRSAGRCSRITSTSSTWSGRRGSRWGSGRPTAGCGWAGHRRWWSSPSCWRCRSSAATPRRPT